MLLAFAATGVAQGRPKEEDAKSAVAEGEDKSVAKEGQKQILIPDRKPEIKSPAGAQ